MGTRSASRASRTTSKEKKDETQGLGLRGVGSVIAGSASSAGLRPGSAGSGEKAGERELTNGLSFKHVQMITVIDEVCFIYIYSSAMSRGAYSYISKPKISPFTKAMRSCEDLE